MLGVVKRFFMIDVKVYIENPVEFTQDDVPVFVKCKLPAIPQIGSVLYLSDELTEELERKCNNYEFKGNYENYLNDEGNAGFADCWSVKEVSFRSNSKVVNIVIGLNGFSFFEDE